ncbi:MAG: hypothetical protein JF587_05140 [Catenulisporales bacterium]|nr:hypothetical protein [Catenulisporales bacterium]
MLMAVRLLVPVPVGMADNNDGSRLLCLVGADARVVHDAAVPFWRYVVETYPSVRPGHHCEPYPSTMVVPAWLAAEIHKYVLGLSGAVDLRELAVEYCLIAGFVVWGAARLVRGLRIVPRAVVLGALFLILAEATFADYANSPYTETAALWGLAVFAVAGVAAMTKGPAQHAAYVIAWLSALFAVGAKVETLTLVVPLGAFFAVRKMEWGRLSGGRRSRVIPMLAVASLLGMAMWQGGAFGGGPHDQQTNTRNELTMALMPLSDDPGTVATGLGLPRSFGSYSGTSIWSEHPIQQDPAFDASRVTLPRIGGYLATHPRLTARVLASGSGPFLRMFRTGYYIGDYTKADSQGRSQREDHRVAVISWVAHHFAWIGFGGILAYWTACFVGAAVFRRRSEKGTLRHSFATVALVLAASSVIQYLTAVFGEGNEVTKHLVISLFCATLAPLWIFAAGFARSALPESAPEPVAARVWSDGSVTAVEAVEVDEVDVFSARNALPKFPGEATA